jgi:hypothetical protein
VVPELRPRSIGEILDAAVATYRARFGALLAVSAGVTVPVTVLSALVWLSAESDDVETAPIGGVTPVFEDNLEFAATVVVLLVTTLTGAFVTAIVTRVVASAYVDHAESTPDAVRNVARRLPAVVGLAIVVAVGVFGATLACVVPGLLLQAAWAVAVPALVLESTGVFAALRRSFALTRSRFWLAFGVFWTATLLGTALNLGIAALLGLAYLGDDTTTASIVVDSVATGLSSVFTAPLTATALVALYFDLRIRAEAFDVQMMLLRLDARGVRAAGAT